MEMKTQNLISVRFVLNGQPVEVGVAPAETLVETLRSRLKMTGTKKGCNEGECGACTVLLDGEPVTSCLIPTAKVHNREVFTIEGMANGDRLHPIQQSFIDAGAVQCGYCTPGMILSTKALLDKNESPEETEVRRALSGNICRCTGYVQILDAVMMAAEKQKETDSHS
jgi:carbon-monoxide dehydrogenase small subunit